VVLARSPGLTKPHYDNIRANITYSRLDSRGRGRVQLAAELPLLYTAGRWPRGAAQLGALRGAQRPFHLQVPSTSSDPISPLPIDTFLMQSVHLQGATISCARRGMFCTAARDAALSEC
jgi:hypothetical protein